MLEPKGILVSCSLMLQCIYTINKGVLHMSQYKFEPYDRVKVDISWINDLYFDTEDDTIEASTFVEPLLIFCKEMLDKYESNTESGINDSNNPCS